MLPNQGALFNERYRILISTDIGGSDADDFQSLVHYLLYSDLFDTEGIISSAWGDGRVSDILEVIDLYEKDYPKLKAYSERYPTPEYLRSIAKQGEIDFAPYKGFRTETEGSEWIIECARKQDSRPLYILAWGLLEDIAQALHDAPDIVDRIRVNYIGGPNKKWGLNAYEYIRREFPNLWIIEDNSTYRGWYNGGCQEADYSNSGFVASHVRGHGAMGEYFASWLDGKIKMGDTPTVAYFLNGTPENPTGDSWGGSFVPVYHRPCRQYYRDTTIEDKVEIFEVIEYIFYGPKLDIDFDKPCFKLVVRGQEFNGYSMGNGEYRVRFMAKSLGVFEYTVVSSIQELNCHMGAFTSVPETLENRREQGQGLTHWYADRLDESLRYGVINGAVSINQYRREILDDFKKRLDRLKD